MMVLNVGGAFFLINKTLCDQAVHRNREKFIPNKDHVTLRARRACLEIIFALNVSSFSFLLLTHTREIDAHLAGRQRRNVCLIEHGDPVRIIKL